MFYWGGFEMKAPEASTGVVRECVGAKNEGGVHKKENLITHKGGSSLGEYMRRSTLFMFMALVIMFLCPGSAVDVKAADACVISSNGEVNASFFSNSVNYTEVRIKKNVTATVNGDVNATIPVILEDDATLTVNGSMQATSRLTLEKRATLTVTGNYTQKENEFKPYGVDAQVNIGGSFSAVSTGAIASAGANATVNVGGDFVYNSTIGCWCNEATWNIKGNVSRGDGDKDGGLAFNQLHLTGANEQRLTLKEGDTISKLYMEGSKKLNLPAYINTEIYTDADITTGGSTIFNGFVIKSGKKINVNGNMKSVGKVHLDEKATLTVTGNYTQDANEFQPYGVDAQVNIGGSFSAVSTGAIASAGANATVNVGGDFVYNSTKGCWCNEATWRISGDVTEGPKQGALEFNVLELLTKGASVTINSGRINTLVLDCGLSNFDIPNVCYDNVRATVKASFDANGGNVGVKSMLITTGEKYDQLPTPTRSGKAFAGWFTERNGGAQVTNDTKSTAVDDHTLYAHWEDAKEEAGETAAQENKKPVSSVSLNESRLVLEKGMTYQLTAVIAPADATDKQLKWSSSNTSVAKVSDSGLVTAASNGNTIITVITNDGDKKATCEIKVVNPVKAPKKLKISSVKNSKSRAMVVKWKKLKGAKGYEVEYALNKKFTKTLKSKDAKTKTSITLTKLKKNKKYYVRVRAYVKNSLGENVYGKWSDVKKIKISK